MLLLSKMKAVCAENNLSKPVLILACPAAEGVVNCLGERKSIYYCADEYSVFPGMDSQLVSDLEERLLNKVDTIVTTSKALFRSKQRKDKPVYYLPHGVDFEHFSKARDPATLIPGDMLKIKTPVLGFHGLIQDLIDFQIIQGIARKRPDWSIVLIGDTIFDVKNLPGEKNIHYLGRKPYEDIPACIKAFNVCLIPYKIVKRTVYANPIKLREYLATGKPIVSTPLPEVLCYQNVVRIASDTDGFIKQIEDVLNRDCEQEATERLEAVKDETWEKVTDRFEAIINGSGNEISAAGKSAGSRGML